MSDEFTGPIVCMIYGWSQTPSTSPFRYEDCGKSKGCFVMPSGCQNRADCKIATSYRQISPSVFEFEIYGTPSGVNSYVAMAFSKDNHMVLMSPIGQYYNNCMLHN